MRKKLKMWTLPLFIGLLLPALIMPALAKDKHDLKDKFFLKTAFLLEKSDEIGLSSSQVDSIKEAKWTAKREVARLKGEIEVIKLDIYKELYKDNIDTNRTNQLINKKYELKSEKTKAIVAGLAAVKNTVNEKQWNKYKKLKKEHKEMHDDKKMCGQKCQKHH